MTKVLIFIFTYFACLFALAYLAGPQTTDTSTFGFLSGLLHGFVAAGALIVSIFSDTHKIYATNNTGFFYNWGFLIGIYAFTHINDVIKIFKE